jgi:hypothetical protein
MSIIKALHKSFAVAKARNWEKQYWAVDIHGTIVAPNYQLGNIPREFYPLAKRNFAKNFFEKRYSIDSLYMFTPKGNTRIFRFLSRAQHHF